ncbi:MAG: outer membrane lipid asymmetry maintenance protein MlaD [Gammaproteobacteria bacterium]|nr:outer membrane lipid asymmetry maintenance protein MlaD [Gammaproteobacteria bacterium]MBU6508572.1 outer membrane lipid asymmetry maintenance protein MlaD [Gammaproteobacteria bacterium]MDE1983307.1 outer membrane lipid asymmetry maintenance protein MlaD [Gammaproteobacteria bacterium]MDE2107870.1 outer membrane lipid asymmetry maintenance protein MlaD [Gammaproteobacteria bacterium]
MRQTRSIEISTGLFIILGFCALLFLAFETTNIQAYGDTGGYDVIATFTNVGGLKVRAPVTMAGVSVGRVTGIRLDPQTFNAVVTMRIASKYDQIPDDSAAAILTSGLLGEQYVGLSPGASETFLKNGAKIQQTQSAIILENLIGQFLFNKASSGGSK